LKRGKPLKRGGPLQRKTPLKTKSKLKASRGLEPGKPLERRKPMKRAPMKRARPRVSLFDDRAMRRQWHDDVVATAARDGRGRRVCPVCETAEQRGTNPLEAHHVTSQELIRKYVRALRLPAYQASEMLARLRWDVRNGLPVCRRCHDLHTRAQERIPLRLVTPGARQFARELIAEYLLDRYYTA
jgi:hypothetical protein